MLIGNTTLQNNRKGKRTNQKRKEKKINLNINGNLHQILW